MMNQLPQMSWFDPLRLYWLTLVPIAILVLFLGYQQMSRRLQRVQVAVGAASGRWTLKRGLALIKGSLFVLAFSCLIISSAGPRLGWTWIESRQSGIDMVVAVDVSKSMMAQDLDPSRLEQARRMIIDLLDVAPGDRIGLVVFAGAAFVQCPLTVDHGALRSFLDGMSTDMIPVGGTDISGALRESLRALDAGGEEQGLGKVIVLLTDGEEHQGDLDAAIAEVNKSKAKVITVGMASRAGSPIADPQGGFVKDNQGNVVVSRLMEQPLQNIAEKTGGQYINAAESGSSIAKIYQDVIRAKGTVRETQAKKERLWYERFQWTAALGLILMIIEMLLADVRLTTTMIWLLSLPAFFSAHEARAGVSNLERYNQAVEAFSAGETEKARQDFEQIAESGSGEEQRRALYNLGNIMAVAGQFDEAVKRYEAALAMDSQDQQVRDNLAWARRKSQASGKDQKQDNKDQQKKDKDGKQDEKNQDSNKQDQNKQDQNKQDEQKNGKTEGKNQDKDKQQSKDQKESEDQKKQDDKNQSSPDNQKSKDQQGKTKEEQAQQQSAQKDNQPMTPEEAEKLLRAAPDDRKTMIPIFRGDKMPPRSTNKDW